MGVLPRANFLVCPPLLTSHDEHSPAVYPDERATNLRPAGTSWRSLETPPFMGVGHYVTIRLWNRARRGGFVRSAGLQSRSSTPRDSWVARRAIPRSCARFGWRWKNSTGFLPLPRKIPGPRAAPTPSPANAPLRKLSTWSVASLLPFSHPAAGHPAVRGRLRGSRFVDTPSPRGREATFNVALRPREQGRVPSGWVTLPTASGGASFPAIPNHTRAERS